MTNLWLSLDKEASTLAGSASEISELHAFCRYTGPSLADFLQSLLDIADLRLRSRQAELEEQEPHQSRRELREAESEKEEVAVEQEPLIPDLLYMGPDLGEGMKITDEVKPRDFHPDHWNLTQFHAAGLMVRFSAME